MSSLGKDMKKYWVDFPVAGEHQREAS